VSELIDYTRGSGFVPGQMVRRLVAEVRAAASERANRAELGAWMFTFARIAVMTPAELKERGCPEDEVEALLRFAMDEAVSITTPIVRYKTMDPGQLRQVGQFIARIARLRWGTAAANAAYSEWLKSGLGLMTRACRLWPEVAGQLRSRVSAQG
jgi:hypothetical protein